MPRASLSQCHSATAGTPESLNHGGSTGQPVGAAELAHLLNRALAHPTSVVKDDQSASLLNSIRAAIKTGEVVATCLDNVNKDPVRLEARLLLTHGRGALAKAALPVLVLGPWVTIAVRSQVVGPLVTRSVRGGVAVSEQGGSAVGTHAAWIRAVERRSGRDRWLGLTAGHVMATGRRGSHVVSNVHPGRPVIGQLRILIKPRAGVWNHVDLAVYEATDDSLVDPAVGPNSIVPDGLVDPNEDETYGYVKRLNMIQRSRRNVEIYARYDRVLRGYIQGRGTVYLRAGSARWPFVDAYLVRITQGGAVRHGDSGSCLLAPQENGNFCFCGMVIGSNEDEDEPVAVAIPFVKIRTALRRAGFTSPSLHKQ